MHARQQTRALQKNLHLLLGGKAHGMPEQFVRARPQPSADFAPSSSSLCRAGSTAECSRNDEFGGLSPEAGVQEPALAGRAGTAGSSG